MPSRDLDPVTRLTADAVGEPGQRTFYLQAASGSDQVTLLVEKEQVRRLAESLEAWLPELASDRPEDPGEAAAAEAGELALAPPLEPDFRVGQLSLSYDAERDRVVVIATELQAGEEEDPVELPRPARGAPVRDPAPAAGPGPPGLPGGGPRPPALPPVRQPARPHRPHLPGHERPPPHRDVSTGAPDPDSGEHDRAVVSEERARAFLAAGELELLGRIPWASNATVLAKVTHEGLEGLAVYKPARGERPLWDFPSGTLYRREVAAYLVSEQLGWRLVPPTLARDGPLGIGSVQLYVDADPEVTAFELLADGNPSMARIAAFDVVTNNADRKAGHCLAGQDGHVWAIDHGLCFHVQAKLRTVLWDLAGDRLDAAVLADLEALAAEATGGPLAASLGELLDPDEVAAMARRARALVRTGRLPDPRGERAYPWPLV